jgi:diguanylate cyclase (GGDEF)-like protein
VLRLIQNSSVPFWHGGVLLGVQAIVDALRVTGAVHTRARITSMGILVAIQCFVTASVLWHHARRQVRAPAIFSAVLLLAFGGFNLLRSAVETVAYGQRILNHHLALITFALYIAVALGLSFGFFWMTTSTLTQELEHIASTDPLTRLYNRRVFMKWCEKELLRSHRSGVPFSLLMVDLDHFKRINDDFGHQTGDEVLCSAVEKMQDSVRGIDVVCRWGGEEFAVLLPNAPVEATRIVAERIRENIQKVTLSAGRSPGDFTQAFSLTVSIGTATYRDFGDDLAAMFQRADKALYEAKNAGRNRVLVAC